MKRMNGQKGFLLIEMLLALGISSIIVTSLGVSLHQFIRISDQGNAKLSTLHDVRNAGFWINRDGGRAESTNLVEGAGPVNTVTMNWTAGGQAHVVTYSLSGTEIKRDHNGNVITIARHVTQLEFSLNQRVISTDMTSSITGRADATEIVSLKTWLRPTLGGG